ncbi:MAG TPA: DUF3618 domain-containing protein [Magnetospirillum sp.]|jgi:ElaB/YqjD/DUF883 family membrane-anchored ribosome-binding protein|nr:DUF3618 domain-containing protein [Magnetospirillum sp.]
MSTEEIEVEIERTRGEMADILTAIERKLSLQQIMDQAVDTMREFLSDRSRIADMVRENPIPLALVGLGVGWMAVSAASGRSAEARMGSYESMEGVGSGWGGESGTAGYGSAGAGAEYAGAGAAERLEGRSHQAREAMQNAAERARSRVNQWSHQARASAYQAAGRTRDAYHDHPLTMGAAALMLGAAVGALLPRSRAESQLIGEKAGTLAHQARQAGSELVEKAGRVAERAVQAGKEEGERALRQESGSPSSMTH